MSIVFSNNFNTDHIEALHNLEFQLQFVKIKTLNEENPTVKTV